MGQMKVAVLGVGGMGGGVIAQMRRCELVSEVIAVDIREERLVLFRKQGVKATANLDEALADDEVRLVFVTASNAAHKELVLASLEAGKAVMCEKPIATTVEDARLMVEAAERLGAFFQIGFELRYSKLYTTVKEWIDAGLLGEVNNSHCYYISSEFHGKGSWRNQLDTGGGMFGEKLCHYVDLPRWWIGSPVIDVYSACSPNVIPYYEVRDNYHTTYRFANGAVSHLTFHMAIGATFQGDPLQNVVTQQHGDGHALQYLVAGTKGAAAADVFARQIKRWEYGDSPKSMTSKWVEDLTWDPAEDAAYFHDGAAQNLDIVRRVVAGEPPMTPARDAFETMLVVFAAEKSADEGRIVRLDEIS